VSRHEIKLVGLARDYDRVRCELSLLPALLCPLHPTRTVQSIYLDSHDQAAVRDNLAGISRRRKVRFRWYGTATASARGRLEQKRRDNLLGDKRSFPIDDEIALDGARRHDFVRVLARALPPAGRELLHGLEPAQWVRYRRDYLADTTGLLRVTIDRELVAFDQRCGARLSCRHPTALPDLLVVEIKADAAHRDAIEQFLQLIPLRPSKCSKFVLASAPREAPPASAWR
jgi:hypothetical protein